jgi:hypothetical protein
LRSLQEPVAVTVPSRAFTILFAIVTHYRNQHPHSSRTVAPGVVAL